MCVRTYTRKQYEIFYKIQKVKYLPHLLSNHRNFLSESYISTSFVNVRSTQKVRATQNVIKDKMTGRVNILWRILAKIAKKLKLKSQGQKNFVFG